MAKFFRLAIPKLDSDNPIPPAQPAIAPEAVREQLQRILSSELFVTSERLRRFLHFVAEETVEGRRDQLKEYSLGVAVFDRGSTFDPRTDPIVRVEAGRLRIRLSTYYSTVGDSDPLIIDLPKGGYGITYALRPEPRADEPDIPPAPASPDRPWLDWRTIGLAVTLAVVGLLAFQNVALRKQVASPRRAEIPPEVAALWAPFLGSSSESVVVFGSPMFFEAEEKRLFVRPYDVNDPNKIQDNPALAGLRKTLGRLSEPRYAYAQLGDAVALHRLGTFLGTYGESLNAVPAHLASWDSIKDKNIIFLGSARMMPVLARLPLKLDFDVQPENSVVNRNPRPGEKNLYSTPSHADAFSYVVIATSPGLRPNRGILVITSHGSAGTQAGVEYLTSRDTLRELVSKLRPDPAGGRYYQVLLRVHSERDEAFQSEYVTHHTALP